MGRQSFQDEIFADSEGNAWFRRNSAALNADGRRDPVLDLLRQLPAERRARVRSMCDVGCANGGRLANLREWFPNATRIAGFDASADAIEAGTLAHEGLDLRVGLVAEPPFEGRFDLVTIGFVMHWVDRSLLTRAIAEIDALVADGGLLVIADFLPDRPCRRNYHHRGDLDLFTYKQDYPRTFAGLGTYRELSRFTFDHGVGTPSVSSDQDRAVCAVLQKSLDYPTVDA
jgi:SAM-dependent methyltransferase